MLVCLIHVSWFYRIIIILCDAVGRVVLRLRLHHIAIGRSRVSVVTFFATALVSCGANKPMNLLELVSTVSF